MKLRTFAPVLIVMAAPLVLAKLPALTPEAQAKADDAKAKAAWTDKVGGFQLCRAMERVADGYFKTAKSAGKEASAPVATPPCAEPGPYVSASAASAPPLEAAGAHSPPGMAVGPPSSKATQAEIQGPKK